MTTRLLFHISLTYPDQDLARSGGIDQYLECGIELWNLALWIVLDSGVAFSTSSRAAAALKFLNVEPCFYTCFLLTVYLVLHLFPFLSFLCNLVM